MYFHDREMIQSGRSTGVKGPTLQSRQCWCECNFHFLVAAQEALQLSAEKKGLMKKQDQIDLHTPWPTGNFPGVAFCQL